jgi:hypothetical protein
MNDDSSVQLLLLTPDGKLVVRQGREDTDVPDATTAVMSPAERSAYERSERFREWRDSLKALRDPPKERQGGPGLPGA